MQPTQFDGHPIHVDPDKKYPSLHLATQLFYWTTKGATHLLHVVDDVHVSQPTLHGTQSPFGLIQLVFGQKQVLSVESWNGDLHVWHERASLHLSQYWRHFWQYLTPLVAMPKKVPTEHLHDPSLLLVAPATHAVHLVNEVHWAQPSAHGLHVLVVASS